MGAAGRPKHADYYEFFHYYFTHGMNYTKALEKFGHCNSHATAEGYAKEWSYLKRTHEEEYVRAKEDFYDYAGISDVNVITMLYDIAMGKYDAKRDQVQAAKLLLDIWDRRRDDSTAIYQAKRLVVEVVGECSEEAETDES